MSAADWVTLTSTTTGLKLAWLQFHFIEIDMPCDCIVANGVTTMRVRLDQLGDAQDILEAANVFDDDDARWAL